MTLRFHLCYFLLPIFTRNLFIDANGNMTREECLAIERTNSFRTSSKVVSVHEGNPAYLHCSIPHSSDSLVAWTRLTDDALLTAGGNSFTTDARFQVSPKRDARDWVLIIRRVQLSDSGCYICEINTEPSTLFPVYLDVLPALVEEEKAASPQKQKSRLNSQLEGGTLLLNCTVEMPEQLTPIDIIWTKDSQAIELNDRTKYKSDYKIVGNTIIYTLRIASVSSQDDGQYACEGKNLPRSAQMVHVNANSSIKNTLNAFLFLFIWLLNSR
uniref:Ig-like domain-containing protein n=2 Tax=Acrobeloides nanus TaxID=290746 RepID=A0A914BX65_9BILA